MIEKAMNPGYDEADRMAAGLQKKTATADARPVPFPALKFIDLFSGIERVVEELVRAEN